MADEWWAYKESRLSPNTVGGYRVAKRRAVERFGVTPIKDITTTQVRAWLDWLGNRDTPERPKVANHLIVITEIFCMGV